MNETWHQWAEQNGYRVSFGAIGMVETARNILEEFRSKKMIDETFYKEWFEGFKFLNGIDTDSFKTLVMVAIPKAAYIMDFEYNGRPGSVVIPPTYVHYKPTFNKILEEALSEFRNKGHSIELIDAPFKTLAVLTGLVKYGRNNVVYTPEMGSYLQLVGLITDMTVEAESVKKTLNIQDNLMPNCLDCSACQRTCPTGAITESRMLLHAEKCYTPLSEKPGELPETPLPPSPECIIGCLKCQTICPMNKGKLNYKKTPFSLSGDETSFIVHHFDTEASIWANIINKFSRLQLSEGCEIFARNFQHMMKLKEINDAQIFL